MLGSDLYKIEGIETVYGTELKSLVLLYREIAGQEPIATFLSLIFQNKTDFKNLSYLLDCLNLTVTSFELHLEELEKVNLIDTYRKNDQYIFVLKKPLAYREFIDHELYGRLLLHKVSKEYYQFLIQRHIYDHSDKSGYTLINHQNNFESLASWDEENEKEFKSIKPIDITTEHSIESFFPVYDFMKEVSSLIFPLSLRTVENLKEIALLADTYGITKERMRINLMNATTVNPPKFDVAKMRILCRNSKSEFRYESGNKYQVPCAIFIAKLQDGKELTAYDKRIIDQLVNNYHLKPEVINVLIEHSLQECDNKLISSYIYAVAANWYRNDVDTYQKALEELKGSAKAPKRNYAKKKEEVLPVYDSSNNPTISDEEFKALLREAGKLE